MPLSLCIAYIVTVSHMLLYCMSLIVQALIFGRFSSASDVWSFAALLYEIWSLGHKPFEDVDNQEVRGH